MNECQEEFMYYRHILFYYERKISTHIYSEVK